MGATTRMRNRNGQFGSSKGFFKSGSTLERGVGQFQFKMMDKMVELAEDVARELETHAKSKAPWDDRTGDARSGITAEVQNTDDLIVLQLFHTVDYGVWLEVRWGGKYAVILPTIEQKGPDVLDKMKFMMDRIVFYD